MTTASDDSACSPGKRGRGFLRCLSVASLRRKQAHPAIQALWQRLCMRTQAVTRRTVAEDFSTRFGSLAWHSATPMLPEAALQVLVDEDREALAYVTQSIAYIQRHVDAGSEPVLLHSFAQLAIAGDMLRGVLDEQSLKSLTSLMREHAIGFGLDQDPSLSALGSNVQLARDLQCATCALLWGPECGHPKWQAVVDRGIERMAAYLQYGCDATGHSYEGTGYGNAVFRLVFQWAELLRCSDRMDAYRTLPRLRKVLEASLQSLLPDRCFLTNDNDHGLAAAESLWFLLPAARRYRDPVYRALWNAYQGPQHPIRPYGDQATWIAEQLGSDEAAADPTSSMFYAFVYWNPDQDVPALETIKRPTVSFSEGTHQAQMRSSWSSDAVFAQFLGAGRSRMSLTHRHADAGHLSLFAYGDYLVIDTGRYNVDEDQHSVVMVDGKPFVPQAPGWPINQQSGRFLSAQHDPPVTHVCADMAQMKGCYWALRHLLFVTCGADEAYALLIDDINPDNRAHDFLWQLQVHPTAAITIHDTHEAQVAGQHARLDATFLVPGADLHPQDPHTLRLDQDVKGWQQPYGPDQPITGLLACDLLLTSVSRPRLLAHCHGVNGKIMALLSPRRTGEPARKVERWTAGQTMGMRIHTSEGIDTILTAPSHGLIETPALRCMSELLWLRHDSDGRLLRTWTLNDAAVTWYEGSWQFFGDA